MRVRERVCGALRFGVLLGRGAHLISREDSRLIGLLRTSVPKNVVLKCGDQEEIHPVCSLVYIIAERVLGNSLLPSAPLCGILNMEKEIEDMITGNRWKQAYEVSELSMLRAYCTFLCHFYISKTHCLLFYISLRAMNLRQFHDFGRRSEARVANIGERLFLF